MIATPLGFTRLVLLLFTASLPVSAGWSADPARESTTINLMSWNIRYDTSRDGVNAWPERKDWVAEIIRREQADLVGLQEVLKHQLDDLRERLPHMDSYGVGRDDGQTRGEYVPILYRKERFEVVDRDTFWLSLNPDQPGSRDWDAAITRIASWIKLKDRQGGQVFYVINTHFDHRGATARVNSAKLLVKRLREKFHDHPVLLVGDFNTKPGTEPYQSLTENKSGDGALFRDAIGLSAEPPQGPDSTWNGFREIVPGQRIDFVFVTDSVRVLRHRILDDQREGRFPSDHLPVWTAIGWDESK
jgi:endonuclease/exonuclease/phosphatase family metal-dependent hydrolase